MVPVRRSSRAVRWGCAGIGAAGRDAICAAGHLGEHTVADLLLVLLTVGLFAALGLLVRAVERL